MVVMYFIVLFGGGGNPAVIPQPFTSLEACQKMGEAWRSKNFNRTYDCVPHEDTRRFKSPPVAAED